MRTVIEEPIVSETIDRETCIYPRVQDAFDALKWWLAHRPESGEIIDDLHWLFKQAADHHANIPAISVVYTYDTNHVLLKFIVLRMTTVA